jgi:MHS family proline/betaine transporter-like MFS transporter
MLMLMQGFVGLLLAICLGALPALLADIYPTGTRGTGLALSYNFSVTLFGGFSPLIVTWLIKSTHDKLAPSYYVMATAVVSLVAVTVLSRRARSVGMSASGIAQSSL